MTNEAATQSNVTARPLPPTGFVREVDLVGDRKRTIRGIIPFSAATLWRKVKAKQFPSPVKLSEGVTAWRVEEVSAWMANHQPSST